MSAFFKYEGPHPTGKHAAGGGGGGAGCGCGDGGGIWPDIGMQLGNLLLIVSTIRLVTSVCTPACNFEVNNGMSLSIRY